jgi:hypothetical protein
VESQDDGGVPVSASGAGGVDPAECQGDVPSAPAAADGTCQLYHLVTGSALTSTFACYGGQCPIGYRSPYFHIQLTFPTAETVACWKEPAHLLEFANVSIFTSAYSQGLLSSLGEPAAPERSPAVPRPSELRPTGTTGPTGGRSIVARLGTDTPSTHVPGLGQANCPDTPPHMAAQWWHRLSPTLNGCPHGPSSPGHSRWTSRSAGQGASKAAAV